MRGIPIDITEKATLLGTTLDTRLNMMANLDIIKHKVAPRIRKLEELRNWGPTKPTLRLIYLSLIRPIMEAGYHIGLHQPKYLENYRYYKINVYEPSTGHPTEHQVNPYIRS